MKAVKKLKLNDNDFNYQCWDYFKSFIGLQNKNIPNDLLKEFPQYETLTEKDIIALNLQFNEEKNKENGIQLLEKLNIDEDYKKYLHAFGLIINKYYSYLSQLVLTCSNNYNDFKRELNGTLIEYLNPETPFNIFIYKVNAEYTSTLFKSLYELTLKYIDEENKDYVLGNFSENEYNQEKCGMTDNFFNEIANAFKI